MDLIFLFGVLEFFGDIWNDLFVIIFMLVGILLGVFLRPWSKNKVLKLHPKDHRYDDLEITNETAISLECKKRTGMLLQRFFKTAPGFTGITGKIMPKPTTIFLGMEGTAYVQNVKTRDKKCTLAEAAQTVLGESFYKSIPEKQRSQLEASKMGVTVELDEFVTPEGMKPITEEDIFAEDDRHAATNLWKAKKQAEKGAIINLILGIGTGFAICAGLVLLGIFKTAPIEIIKIPVNGTQATLAMLWDRLVTVI